MKQALKQMKLIYQRKMWCKTILSPTKSDDSMEQNKQSRLFSKIM